MVLARIARSRGLRLRSLLQPRAWSQNWAFSRAKGRAVQPYAPSSGPWSQRGVCGSGALRGAVVGGVAGLGDRRRFGGLAGRVAFWGQCLLVRNTWGRPYRGALCFAYDCPYPEEGLRALRRRVRGDKQESRPASLLTGVRECCTACGCSCEAMRSLRGTDHGTRQVSPEVLLFCVFGGGQRSKGGESL